MQLDPRKEHLLGLVIESYIETKQPIGSRFLTETGLVNVSGATIRNELRALEEAGFLSHPHTSAGRIPTEAGYQHYVDNIMEQEKAALDMRKALDGHIDAHDDVEKKLKACAKYLAEKSGNAVIIAFGPERMYYTGMSHLFSQPEFVDSARTVQMSSVFDHCEERLAAVVALLEDDLHVLIGKENPLGGVCSTMAAKFANDHLMLVLGPMRMPYKQNLALLQYIQSKLS